MFAQATIFGCLCNEPESFTLPSGTQKVTLRLASNKKRKNPNGSYKEEQLFIDAVCFSRTAEVAMTYLKKGSWVLVSGDLCMDTFVNRAGINTSKIYVIANELRLMPKSVAQSIRQAEQVYDISGDNPQASAEQSMQAKQSVNDDEIPF